MERQQINGYRIITSTSLIYPHPILENRKYNVTAISAASHNSIKVKSKEREQFFIRMKLSIYNFYKRNNDFKIEYSEDRSKFSGLPIVY